MLLAHSNALDLLIFVFVSPNPRSTVVVLGVGTVGFQGWNRYYLKKGVLGHKKQIMEYLLIGFLGNILIFKYININGKAYKPLDIKTKLLNTTF